MIVKMTPEEQSEFDKAWSLPVKAEDVLPRIAPLVSPETELVFEYNGKAYSVLGRISDVKDCG